MCLTEIWTYRECGCRFDHHVPCHAIFSRSCSPARTIVQPPPATPPPSRSANDNLLEWPSLDGGSAPGFQRQCSVRHFVQRAFVEPICDECLIEEWKQRPEVGPTLGSRLGAGTNLKTTSQPINPANISHLEGENWLLESQVEIKIDQVLQGQPRQSADVGSIGDGDADDEGALDVGFRGRSARRRGIDITRTDLRIASGWSSGEKNCMQLFKDELQLRAETEGKRSARGLVRKMKEGDLKNLAAKTKNGLRLKIRGRRRTSRGSDSTASQSTTKSDRDFDATSPERRDDNASSSKEAKTGEYEIDRFKEPCCVASAVPNLPQSSIDAITQIEIPESVSSAGRNANQEGNHNLRCHKDCHPIVSSVSISPAEESTPTSISSSAVFDQDKAITPPQASWEDHLRHDLQPTEKKFCPPTIPNGAGCRDNLPSDGDGHGHGERQRFLSSETIFSLPQTASNASSANWVGFADDHRLDGEISANEFDIPETEPGPGIVDLGPAPSTFPTPFPTSATAEQHARHSHTGSVSSVASFTTAFSHSPQTSPPRPHSRAALLSMHPLATVLQIVDPHATELRDSAQQSATPADGDPASAGV